MSFIVQPAQAQIIQSPQWTFQGTTGDCDSGMFVTDAATAGDTTLIRLSRTNLAGSDASFMASVTVGSILLFTDSVGRAASFTITGISSEPDNGCLLLEISTAGNGITWSGTYSVSTWTTV